MIIIVTIEETMYNIAHQCMYNYQLLLISTRETDNSSTTLV